MKTVIPYTKDILFKSKIAEITSISLEHELNLEDETISGNFIISGDYKAHEVSINKDDFEYKLPFNVELTDNIDKESLKFEIVDFYYEIIGNDILRVNIEFEVEAETIKEEELTRVDEVLFEKVEDIGNEILEEKIKVNEKIVEDVKDDKMEDKKVDKVQENEDEREILEADQNTIINAIDTNENEYFTYKVHIVREMETLEAISDSFGVPMDVLKEYNNIEEINVFDKIIIPSLIDE